MGIWLTKSGELASATDREFERRVLPLLRAFWPGLIRPREMKELDRHGIDLIVWSDGPHFPCVVQCKGLYQDEKLLRSQLPQFLSSIEAFQNSPFSCDKYILVHNRTGQERDVHKRIEEKLAGLREAGKAQETFLWDRQSLIKEAKKRITLIVSDRISARANEYLRQHERIFRFGSLFVSKVPARLSNWRFSSVGSITTDIKDFRRVNIASLVSGFKKRRWTLLVGHFGIGKTTMGLHAAGKAANRLIYVRSEDLPNPFGSVGTNYLMQNVLRSLNLFEEHDDETASELERLAGPLLTALLYNPDTGVALIIDGLDESRTYASARGMTQLTNELADLRCPVVLITRKEHFDSTFGNFEAAIDELTRDPLSSKGGVKREATIVELSEWSEDETFELMAQAKNVVPAEERRYIEELENTARSGELRAMYHGLEAHPLFAQMLLQVATEGMLAPQNRCQLITEWARQKIKRDLRADRPTPGLVIDKNAFVSEMMRLMENVARKMTEESKGQIILLEDVDSGVVELAARAIWLRNPIDISTIVSTSLLVPVGRRYESTIRVRFYHRVFQEFFLARHALRTKTPREMLPTVVGEWCSELDNEWNLGNRW